MASEIACSFSVNRMTSSHNCCKTEGGELISRRMDPSYSSEVIELDLSNMSTDSSQQSSNVLESTAESIQTGRLTWREKLKLGTSCLPGQDKQCECVLCGSLKPHSFHFKGGDYQFHVISCFHIKPLNCQIC